MILFLICYFASAPTKIFNRFVDFKVQYLHHQEICHTSCFVSYRCNCYKEVVLQYCRGLNQPLADRIIGQLVSQRLGMTLCLTVFSGSNLLIGD